MDVELRARGLPAAGRNVTRRDHNRNADVGGCSAQPNPPRFHR